MRNAEYSRISSWERRVTAFLWFPKTIQGEWRWLERTAWIEMWSVYWRRWFVNRWAD